ncbi:unnamed protein product [Rotaria socialis]|uniref:NAD(P)(+)--arginine ADP-ribosyltransferase n=2 Tax=Rotaria socialis TaxID=392032 RepID=A0A818C887_9BILA|nr:unnamed protein product [Rotaria socialis]CAF4226418.1 unnamed protein product [Rotaria socialis]CAF4246044.1 unnamed protein product [Rotaria socialis]CAF4511732.1 unnamed protein product [Rotaria socialis]
MPANQSKRKRAIEVHNKKVTQRGNVPKSGKQADTKTPVGPWLLALFVFVVVVCDSLTADSLRSIYMKVPTLPLGQSVIHIPVSGSIKPSVCVTQSLATATPTKGLTTEEVAVIKSYTSSCRLYEMLNAALRTEQQANIQPWFAYLKLFQMAIVKIPAKHGSYCRGITGDYHNMYKVGSTVVWWGISSVSASESVCIGFATPSGSTVEPMNGTLFTILSSSARGIVEFSNFPHEAESILLPATKFKVLSNKLSTNRRGLYEITLQEIEAAPSAISKLMPTVKIKATQATTKAGTTSAKIGTTLTKLTIKIGTTSTTKAGTTSTKLTTKLGTTSTKLTTKTGTTSTKLTTKAGPTSTIKIGTTSTKLTLKTTSRTMRTTTRKTALRTTSRLPWDPKPKPISSLANTIVEKR